MADPLKIKTEKAVLGYLLSLAGLAGWNGHRGIRADKVQWPAVIVDVISKTPSFPERGCDLFIVEVAVVLKSRASHNSSGSSDTAEGVHFAAVEAVENALFAELVRPFVNSENIVNRPVTVFHMGNFSVPSQIFGWDKEEQAFMTQFRFKAPVQATDGDA